MSFKKIKKRNGKLKVILGLVVLILVAAAGIFFLLTRNDLNKYNLEVKLEPDKKLYKCNETVDYKNKTDIVMNTIYFHIYPNAYMTSEDGKENTLRRCMSITSIKNNDEKLSYEITASDKTILKIKLNKDLKPGKKIKLEIAFDVNMPSFSGSFGDRFGCTNNKFNFGNWYPIAAVYDSTGWNLDPYYSIGDPFYSEVSDYKVSITVPKNYVIAATGDEDSTIDGNNKTYIFKENKIRDFAFVASSTFKEKTCEIDGIKVKSYYQDDDERAGKIAMDVARDAIKIFDKYYGKYPYKQFSVVETQFLTGMEYPEIVFINEDYYKNELRETGIEGTVMHETAHQWWYNTVGDNEVDEAWLDEGFATFSEGLYYQKLYKTPMSNRSFIDPDNYKIDTKLRARQVIVKPINKFNSWDDYGLLVYRKGAGVLNAIRQKVGDTKFFEMMSTYYDDFKFKNATSKDFINTVKDICDDGTNWDVFFDKWLFDKDEEENVKTLGKFIKTSYVKTIFDAWNIDSKADAFYKKNKGSFVRWTGKVTVVNADNFLILQETYLPEIWARFDDNVVKKNKIKVGDVITVFGCLEDFIPSANIFEDPAEWILRDCKLAKTTQNEKVELNKYREQVKVQQEKDSNILNTIK